MSPSSSSAARSSATPNRAGTSSPAEHLTGITATTRLFLNARSCRIAGVAFSYAYALIWISPRRDCRLGYGAGLVADARDHRQAEGPGSAGQGTHLVGAGRWLTVGSGGYGLGTGGPDGKAVAVRRRPGSPRPSRWGGTRGGCGSYWRADRRWRACRRRRRARPGPPARRRTARSAVRQPLRLCLPGRAGWMVPFVGGGVRRPDGAFRAGRVRCRERGECGGGSCLGRRARRRGGRTIRRNVRW
jgi:hypothetical protein